MVSGSFWAKSLNASLAQKGFPITRMGKYMLISWVNPISLIGTLGF